MRLHRILVIQDSPSVNMMLKYRLETAGFFVEIVETGEEGIQKVRQNGYQLILLDYKLPGIDGPEVCRILRREKSTQNIPIVFISAKDEEEISADIKSVGADGYIGMPFKGKDLVERIRYFMKKAVRADS